jgi:hypothetical protein
VKRLLLCVATLMLTAVNIAFAAGTPARDIAQSGYWTAFMGSIPEGGPACGMSTIGGPTTHQMFMVKWYYGNAYLTIQILKETGAFRKMRPAKSGSRLIAVRHTTAMHRRIRTATPLS